MIHGATLSGAIEPRSTRRRTDSFCQLNLEKGRSAAEIAEAGTFHIFLAIETQEDDRVHRVGMKEPGRC